MTFIQRIATYTIALSITLGSTFALAQAWTQAEVKKVDTAQKKITLQHGDIQNLNMPGMTMVFNVKNAALLQGVQAGDHVQFIAAQEGERYFVTQLKPAH